MVGWRGVGRQLGGAFHSLLTLYASIIGCTEYIKKMQILVGVGAE